jgi:hypothetical protein
MIAMSGKARGPRIGGPPAVRIEDCLVCAPPVFRFSQGRALRGPRGVHEMLDFTSLSLGLGCASLLLGLRADLNHILATADSKSLARDGVALTNLPARLTNRN